MKLPSRCFQYCITDRDQRNLTKHPTETIAQILVQIQSLPRPWPHQRARSPHFWVRGLVKARQPKLGWGLCCETGGCLALHLLCGLRLQHARQDGRGDGGESHELIEVNAAAFQLIGLLSKLLCLARENIVSVAQLYIPSNLQHQLTDGRVATAFPCASSPLQKPDLPTRSDLSCLWLCCSRTYIYIYIYIFL